MNAEHDEIYYLGIDGGATGTDFALESSDGRLLKTLRLPSSNPFDLGMEKAQAVLRQGVEAFLAEYPADRICLFAGLSGGRSGGNRDIFRKFFSGFGFRAFDCDSDTVNAVAVGLNGKDGIVSIIGTGNVTCLSLRGEIRLLGGHGYLFDKGCRAYDVGLAALKETFLAYDGVSEKGTLTRLVSEKCGGDPSAVLECFYGSGAKAYIATFCFPVFEAYKAGDPTAERILRESAESLAVYILTALDDLPEKDRRIVLVGGMNRFEEILSPILRCCPGMEGVDLSFCGESPVKGSLYIARHPGCLHFASETKIGG